MKKLIVTKTFELTEETSGKIFANIGDTLIVKDKGVEYYHILRLNEKNIFSRWMRKSWINAHSKIKTTVTPY